jgi:hypothetical protein
MRTETVIPFTGRGVPVFAGVDPVPPAGTIAEPLDEDEEEPDGGNGTPATVDVALAPVAEWEFTRFWQFWQSPPPAM